MRIKMDDETTNFIDKKRIILKILQDKWEIAGKPKNICVQLKEFEFSGKISPDDIAQIFRGLYEKEEGVKVDSIVPANVEVYKNKVIPDSDSTPYITLYNEGYLNGFHFWDGTYIYNKNDKIWIKIDERRFKRTIKKYKIDKFQVSIEGKTEFIDDEAIIKIGNKKCQLPPYKNEHFFCRAIYEFPVNEPVDWSIIYEKITGYESKYFKKPANIKENWRIVYDTMKRLNKRVEEVLGIKELFVWKNKTIRRTK
jgi:hypothetical protein